MFIEDLWENNPELFKEGLSEALGVDKERLVNDKKGNGYLRFGIKSLYGKGYEDGVIVNDFKIRFMQDKSRPEIVDFWVKFMYGIYDDKYAMRFISQRNQQLDKFMADYEEKYNAETRQMLDKMGFNYGQTK